MQTRATAGEAVSTELAARERETERNTDSEVRGGSLRQIDIQIDREGHSHLLEPGSVCNVPGLVNNASGIMIKSEWKKSAASRPNR